MKMHVLPLELMDSRYTLQWFHWFSEVFADEEIYFENIMPTREIIKPSPGGFFDWQRTLAFKHAQLYELFSRQIQSGDWIFFYDGEFPGLESLHYFEKMCDKDVGIAAIWHAGTYDKWDLTHQKGLTRNGSKLEKVWMDITDVIFVASEWHKRLLIDGKRADKNKIKVTGLPVDIHSLRKTGSHILPRKTEATFTGRLSVEKGLKTVREVQSSGYPLKITAELGLEKEQYYRVLADSKRVFAPSLQETFGYGVVEGMALGCMPVVPNGLSFPDYVPRRFRYNTREEMMSMLLDPVLSEDYSRFVEQYDYPKVIREMISWLRF